MTNVVIIVKGRLLEPFTKMPLTTAERKHRMPYGAQREIATELGVVESYVSAVMNDDARPKTARAQERLRQAQAAIAAKLELPVDDVFPAAEVAAQAS